MAIRYMVPSYVIEFCEEQLAEGGLFCRGRDDGTPEEQKWGRVGEYGVKYLLGLPTTTPSERDSDFTYNGTKYDVKTAPRICNPLPHHIHYINEHQIGYSPDAYIFCTLNTKDIVLIISGWISKKNFMAVCKHRPKGSIIQRDSGPPLTLKMADYAITVSQLRPIEEFMRP